METLLASPVLLTVITGIVTFATGGGFVKLLDWLGVWKGSVRNEREMYLQRMDAYIQKLECNINKLETKLDAAEKQLDALMVENQRLQDQVRELLEKLEKLEATDARRE